MVGRSKYYYNFLLAFHTFIYGAKQ
ncbi:uncharacterized protein METZ01_LOCUS494972, partial [marine metagenome]